MRHEVGFLRVPIEAHVVVDTEKTTKEVVAKKTIAVIVDIICL